MVVISLGNLLTGLVAVCVGQLSADPSMSKSKGNESCRRSSSDDVSSDVTGAAGLASRGHGLRDDPGRFGAVTFPLYSIFFKEDFDNLDKGPKLNEDVYDFVEDKIVFGDDSFIMEVVSHKNPQVFEMVIDDTVVNKHSFMKDFSNYQNFVVSFSNNEVKPRFEDQVVKDKKPLDGTRILEDEFFQTDGE
ncbi:hypothetical protein Sjap_017146 [Stephania japonica]|uniref:Uncharacterized protein n=1 Tax=Stephania japonica TaxID=461633 RepID=A0AAP0I5M0_9MAGN